MASLRGADTVWTAQPVAQNDFSPEILIGPGPYVALYVNNSGAQAATFKIQAAAPQGGAAGRNVTPTQWFDYEKTPGTVASFAVAAGAAVCVDLAPFSPPYARIVRLDAAGSTTIDLFVSCFGPN